MDFIFTQIKSSVIVLYITEKKKKNENAPSPIKKYTRNMEQLRGNKLQIIYTMFLIK